VRDHATRLFSAAMRAARQARWREALALWGGVVKAAPDHLEPRLRMGDALLNLGKQAPAAAVYRSVCEQALEAGHPLVGLVALKLVELVDPDQAGNLVEAAAGLYSRGAARLDALYQPPAPGWSLGGRPLLAEPLVDEGGAAFLERCEQLAAATPRGRRPADHLPIIPLLSHVDEEDFVALVDKLRLRRLSEGEEVIAQGSRGDGLFIVALGEVAVSRTSDGDSEVTLARLQAGSVVGELALISDEPRQASVIARGDADLLELKTADLVVATAMHAGVGAALKQFLRERFLRNLTATHPFFSGLSRDERHLVMARFELLRFDAGERLIAQGDKGPGLFLLLSGEAEVSRGGPERIHLATLRAADLFGEMSILNDQPTNADVIARLAGEALFLPRAAFFEVASAHPVLTRYLAGLHEQRNRQNRALLSGRGLLEDDEHVMV
jgi:CRP-like cAMP-binding protein